MFGLSLCAYVPKRYHFKWTAPSVLQFGAAEEYAMAGPGFAELSAFVAFAGRVESNFTVQYIGANVPQARAAGARRCEDRGRYDIVAKVANRVASHSGRV
jgi:hypothetical protein